MAVPMANDPPFATLNHFAADLGIPSESDLLRIGIRPARRALPARDRGGQGPERIRFSSAILPPYARRSKSLEVLIPMLYLKGASTGLRGGTPRIARQGRRRALGLDHRSA